MHKRWPELWNLCEIGVIKEIDYYFAEKIYPQANLEEAAFLSALMGHSREGNICLQRDSFTSIDKEYESWVRQGSLMENLPDSVVLFDNQFYLKRNFFFETRFIEEVKRLCHTLPSPELVIHEAVSSEQRQAIEQACSHCLSLIVGGPGVGKTHVARTLAAAFGKKVILTAPTGKAASRLGGQTLHSLLKVYSPNHFFQEGEWIDADLIIVDESSMIDIRLFSYLLASISPHTRVVLMGDSEQLPPVESGSVFADLVQAAKEGFPIPCTHLTQVFRTDRREILDLAKAMRLGDQDAVVGQMQPVDIWKDVVDHFPHPKEHLQSPSELLEACDAFRILSCIRKGPKGVDTLNEAIARYFIEKKSPRDRLPMPIMITRTDKGQALSNGDTGVLLYGEDIAYFPGKEIRTIPRSALPPYEYAYCLSVHKSQGSEYDKVLLLVPDGSEVFGREALYTAVTRAKKQVAIDGNEAIIRSAIAKSSRKMSNVCRRLTC